MDLSALIRCGADLRKESRGLKGVLSQLTPRADAAKERAQSTLWDDGYGQKTLAPAQAQGQLAIAVSQRLADAVRLIEESIVLTDALRNSIESGETAEELGDKVAVLSGRSSGLKVSLEPRVVQNTPVAFARPPAATTFKVVKDESRLVRSRDLNGTAALIPESPQLTGDDGGAVAVGSDPHLSRPMEYKEHTGDARRSTLVQDIRILAKEGRWPESWEAHEELARWLESIYPPSTLSTVASKALASNALWQLEQSTDFRNTYLNGDDSNNLLVGDHAKVRRSSRTPKKPQYL